MKRFSLDRSEKLLKSAEFQEVFAQGIKKPGKRLVLYILNSTEACNRKLGVVVTKKIGNAVTRNGIKRRFREAFRLNKECFPEGARVVMIARSGAKNAPFREILQEMLDLVARDGKRP